VIEADQLVDEGPEEHEPEADASDGEGVSSGDLLTSLDDAVGHDLDVGTADHRGRRLRRRGGGGGRGIEE
jgi:hypothetical protein